MHGPIRLARPDVGEAELAAVGEVLATGHLTMGPKVREFEALLAAACERRARRRRLLRHGRAPPRDARARHRARATRSSCPPTRSRRRRTSSSSCGARAVLADVDPDTFNLDLGAPRRGALAADEGRARRAPLRPPARLGGAARRGARGRDARRGRRRRARRAPAGPAVRLARRDGLPLVPSRARSSRPARAARSRPGRASSPSACARCGTTAGARPTATTTCRAAASTTASRTCSARSASRSSSGSRSCSPRASGSRPGTRSGSQTSSRRRRRRRATATAGRRTSSGSTAATRRWPGCGRQGIEAQIGTYALHRLRRYRDQGSFPGADRAFERALALPFHTLARPRPSSTASPRRSARAFACTMCGTDTAVDAPTLELLAWIGAAAARTRRLMEVVAQPLPAARRPGSADAARAVAAATSRVVPR